MKKDPGVDQTALKNREKAVIVDALKNKYSLPLLLEKLDLAKSCYYYQEKVLSKPDKYAQLRKHIKEMFKETKGRYCYRRIYRLLAKDGYTVLEKVVRRIMKQENLVVKIRKNRKYNSYKGEISQAVSNIIERNFRAHKPNQKWLTDITEFAIPAGKVYLSPIVDCFDGLLPCWTISTCPDSNLVNSMLDSAIALLNDNEYPIVHSHRGCHYRWPGWIKRMDKARFTRSMSKKGCSPDNSACEGLFGRLKNEMFYNQDWSGVSIEEFIDTLNVYLVGYNERRIKILLGNMSPKEYRQSLRFPA
ncbi:IS3 family transposase [Clostridium cellulovorans]|uniref:IS3 family transposase n=1 Tax=Clostridium cellulovorans TaxID=1493 RepID=UPI001F60EF60|nr:IS3 family transposase [Clostridium cellulovorans]